VGAFAMRITVKVDTDKMRGLAQKAAAAAALAADQAQEQVWEKAQQYVSVRTGYLWHSLRGKAQGGKWEVVANAYYGVFVEFGTRYMYARPYLRPALDETDLRGIFVKSLKQMGF
jgi:HK97 gp10 family phage protein